MTSRASLAVYKPRELSDVAVGNDKTLVTDTEEIGLEVEVVAIEYTATAGVGTRAVDVVVANAGGQELFRIVAILANTASQVLSAYVYPGSGDGEFPPFVFRPGFTIQVVDTTDTDVLDTCKVWAYFAGTERIG